MGGPLFIFILTPRLVPLRTGGLDARLWVNPPLATPLSIRHICSIKQKIIGLTKYILGFNKSDDILY